LAVFGERQNLAHHDFDFKHKQESIMFLLPEETLVIFCDLHQSLIDRSKTISPDSLTQNNGILAELCLHFGLNSCILTVPVSIGPRGVIKSIQPIQNQKNTLYRSDANPFKEDTLTEYLESASAKNIVISGFSTEVGVMFTAVGALSQGFRVIIAVDAIGSRSSRTEGATINYLTSIGAQILPLATIAVSLESDLSTVRGEDVLSCINRIKC